MKHGLFKAYPRLLALLVGLAIAIVMFLSVEGLFYILNLYKNEDIVERGGDYEKPDVLKSYFGYDELLGYKPDPNLEISSIFKFKGKKVYDVIYSIDNYSRRVTPVSNPEQRDKYILFFGDSFTFGEGVHNNETLPFYFSDMASEYMPYNYGFHGYGPQEMLAKLEDSNLRDEVKEEGGILIYTFIDYHINRAIGRMNVVTFWGENMPYYFIDNDNKLVRKGDFTSGRPMLSIIYNVLSKSQVVKYLRINLPRNIEEDHIKLTARIIEESRNTYKKRFGSDEFYVLFYPGSRWSSFVKRLTLYLENSNIKFLDYSKLLDMESLEYIIEGDGHPTAKAHKAVAEKLVEDLGAVAN